MAKKKLAVIGIRGFPNVQGGAEKHCFELVPRLAETFDCIVYRRKSYVSKAKDLKIPGVKFIDISAPRIQGVETFIHSLFCCLHLLFHRVDCVNIHNIGPGFFAPFLRAFGYKVVLTYHSANYEHKKWGRFSRSFLRLCESLSFRFSNRVIFVSKFQYARSPKEIIEKSAVIPNGVTPFPSAEEDIFLEKHGIIRGGYILAVGRLASEKGFEYLIKAVEDIDEVLQVVIAGAADYKSHYYEYLKECDKKQKVIFTGYANDMEMGVLYKNSRIFALPSLSEGNPIALIDAMAFGIPVVISDIPATHNMGLPPDSYAKAGDVASLKAAIYRMLHQPARMKYDLTEYDWDRIYRQTKEIYETIL